ncbi:MAG: chemotaxis protein CheC, partial [Clostridiales bacterium]|nr:chemotaxis protein CheC [Clostridiales bacterium]
MKRGVGLAAEQTDENRRDMLTETEIDVIGEILNISMGSASTALSAMLDKQVTITTPALEQNRFGELDYSDMDPAIMVKINYVEGISGSNVIVFRSRDMQIILNLLMGNEEIPPEDSQFEFDDMTMSAACEVMNQMMGSSATALSEVLGRIVNISTPTAHISEIGTCIASDLMEMNDDDVVVCVSFSLMVENIMDSNFISFLSIPLARDIISSVMPEDGSEIQPLAPIPETTAEEGLAQAAGEGPGEAASGSAEEAPDPMPSPEAITQPPQQAAEAPAPMPAP